MKNVDDTLKKKMKMREREWEGGCGLIQCVDRGLQDIRWYIET